MTFTLMCDLDLINDLWPQTKDEGSPFKLWMKERFGLLQVQSDQTNYTNTFIKMKS